MQCISLEHTVLNILFILKGTKKPKRNGTRPAKNSGKRIGKSRPEKADNARNRILKQV